LLPIDAGKTYASQSYAFSEIQSAPDSNYLAQPTW
jgi:hypothetical protein